MKFGKILIQEVIRSVALGWIMLMALALLYRGGVLSSTTFWLVLAIFVVVTFAGFMITRLVTGRDLMIHSAKGWSLLAAATNAILLIFVVVGVSLGQTESLFTYGIWPYVAAVGLVGLLSWAGYRMTSRHSE